MELRLLWKVALLGALFVGTGCDDKACAPCRPGTYPSDPSRSCSACLPCPDGGVDAASGSSAVWCPGSR